MAPQRIPLADRFWPKVEKTDGCWLWKASVRRSSKPGAPGYGQIGAPGRRTRILAAHRVSWELANGPIPTGMSVLHRCDNPLCVRPDHLFLGTNLDNIADKAQKGRTTHKLTVEQVVDARRRYAAGNETRYQIAKSMGVRWQTIEGVVSGKTWKRVP